MLDDYYRQYGLVLLLMGAAFAVPLSMFFISRAAQVLRIRPNKPSDVKSDIYECGMETIGGRWVQFNFRYYLFALLFLVFDVTAIFIYPWAITLRELGGGALLVMFAFLESWASAGPTRGGRGRSNGDKHRRRITARHDLGDGPGRGRRHLRHEGLPYVAVPRAAHRRAGRAAAQRPCQPPSTSSSTGAAGRRCGR